MPATINRFRRPDPSTYPADHRRIRSPAGGCVSVVDWSETDLVTALRAGDEHHFGLLVDRYSPMMLSVARTYVGSRHAAEDVVQDTWLAVLKGIDRFEGRSTLRTWLFRILINIAKARGVREHRTTPSAALSGNGATVDAARFRPDGAEWPHHWLHPPLPWDESPEHSLLSGEAVELLRRELDRLPETQRRVVSLRDVDGYAAAEVCSLLDLTPANQRVLLHRGRAKVRQALAGYFGAAR
jgi:RNA polymerase sigma-70 factor (ECF subfamily)